jgi:TfoX/Sxy family transcriptional regulator of competence genes
MAGRECYHCKQWVEEGEEHDCWTTTEAALTQDLSEDLRDAWERLRETAAAFGDQRIYASHKAMMFSRKSCYFFVRPKRSCLELCVFLSRTVKAAQIRRVERVSKSKLAHFIQISHRDEVEAPLTDWLREAYDSSDQSKAAAPAQPPKSIHENTLLDRVRAALRGRIDYQETKMFGGITFIVDGKMCVSVGRERITCRIDPAFRESALKRKGCRTVTMKDREYRGYVYVDEAAVKNRRDLDYWIGLALTFNRKAAAGSRTRR